MVNLKYSQILQSNAELRKTVTGKPYKVCLLSNVTINMLKEILEYSLRINNLNAAIEIGNYDNIMQDSTTIKDADLVVIFYDALNIADSVSDFFEDLDDDKYNNLKHKVYSEIDIIFENLKTSLAVVFNTFSSRYFVSDYFKKI